MFLKRISAVVLVAASMAGTAVAADTSRDKKPAAAEARPDDVICTYEQPVGTHIKRRVCVTRETRELQQRQSQDAAQRMRSPSNNPGAAGGN